MAAMISSRGRYALRVLADLAGQEPIVLEPWDPMGTLANG